MIISEAYKSLLKSKYIKFINEIPNEELINYALKKEIYRQPFIRDSVIDDLMQDLFNSEITYNKASNSIHLDSSVNDFLYKIGDRFLPRTLVHKILNDVELNIKKAMNIYELFLAGGDTTFFIDGSEELFIKFPVNNVHIWAIDYNTMIKYFYNKALSSGSLLNEEDLGDIKNIDFKSVDDYEIAGKIDGMLYTRLNQLKEPCNTELDLLKQINVLNQVQNSLFSFMNDEKEKELIDKKVELLVYFYAKDRSYHIFSNILAKLEYGYGVCDSIVESNLSFFGAKFISLFKGEGKKDIYRKFLEKLNDRNNIMIKYDYLMKVADFCSAKHALLSRKILFFSYNKCSHLTNNSQRFTKFKENLNSYRNGCLSEEFNLKSGTSLESFLWNMSVKISIKRVSKNEIILNIDDEDIVELNFNSMEFRLISSRYVVVKDGDDKFVITDNVNSAFSYFVNKVSNNKYKFNVQQSNLNGIGDFGFAKLYMDNSICDIKNNTSLIADVFNFFKANDKLFYTCNYNFTTDINGVYLVDLQNISDFSCLDDICYLAEMSILGETLVEAFEGVNTNRKSNFFSMQNVDSFTKVSSSFSRNLDLVNFYDSKSIKTIITPVFSDNSNFTNILCQANSDFKKKSLDGGATFIAKLDAGKIELRHATFFSDKFKFDSNSSESSVTLKENEVYRYCYINLVGISNVLVWLESLTIADFAILTGISESNITAVEFEEIRIKLYKNAINQIHSLNNIMNNYDSSLNLNLDSIDFNNLLDNSSGCFDMNLIDNLIDPSKIDVFFNSVVEGKSSITYEQLVKYLSLEMPLFIIEKISLKDSENSRIKYLYTIIKKRKDAYLNFKNLLVNTSCYLDINLIDNLIDSSKIDSFFNSVVEGESSITYEQLVKYLLLEIPSFIIEKITLKDSEDSRIKELYTLIKKRKDIDLKFRNINVDDLNTEEKEMLQIDKSIELCQLYIDFLKKKDNENVVGVIDLYNKVLIYDKLICDLMEHKKNLVVGTNNKPKFISILKPLFSNAMTFDEMKINEELQNQNKKVNVDEIVLNYLNDKTQLPWDVIEKLNVDDCRQLCMIMKNKQIDNKFCDEDFTILVSLITRCLLVHLETFLPSLIDFRNSNLQAVHLKSGMTAFQIELAQYRIILNKSLKDFYSTFDKHAIKVLQDCISEYCLDDELKERLLEDVNDLVYEKLIDKFVVSSSISHRYEEHVSSSEYLPTKNFVMNLYNKFLTNNQITKFRV